MNKKEILEQIKSEMHAEQNARDALREIAFWKARSQNMKLTKDEFYKTYKAAQQKKLTVKQRYTQKLIEQSGFKSLAPSKFTEKLHLNDDYKKIYSALAVYCDKFPNTTKSNIVFLGATGTGKTYASQIIANNLLEKGFSVLYVTAFGLVERFKNFVQSFGNETETDALFDCDLLIIDDLGTEPVIKNISYEYLYNVINERLVSRKAFIITTNLDAKMLHDKYERIASRILSKESSVVIEMKGKDLRLF